MKSGMIAFISTVIIGAAIPLAAQTLDAAPAQKAKAKHVYTDADLRPLDEKCADPSVPAEDKVSCPKAPVTNSKDGTAQDTAKAAADKNAPKLDVNGDPVPDLTKMGTDDLKQRVQDTQQQQDSAQESIDKWSKRLADATTDDDKKMYQNLVNVARQQLKDAQDKNKAAAARLAQVEKKQ